MNSHPFHDQQTLDSLLHYIRAQFYQNQHKQFFRDRRFLLYAITWPASWLHHRALTPSQKRYHQLIRERLDDIHTHGSPELYMSYFPRYLLKVIQDHFAFNEDRLYQEFKHIRNAIEQLDPLLELLQNNQPPPDSNLIDILAHTHHILHPQYRRKSHNNNPQQLSLF